MSKRVALTATLATLFLICVLLGVCTSSMAGAQNNARSSELTHVIGAYASCLDGASNRQELIKELADASGYGLAYYNADGSPAYSAADALTADEIAKTHAGVASSYTMNDASGKKALFAIRNFDDGTYIRISENAKTAWDVFAGAPFMFILIALLPCAAVFIAVYVSLSRREQLQVQIMNVLEQFSDGVYDERIDITGSGSIKQQADEFNAVLNRIQDRIFSQRSRNHALSVVMNQMQNGIVVVDDKLHLLFVTPVARKLLGISNNSEGMPIAETSKDVHLDSVFSEAMRQGGVYTNEVAAKTAVGRGHRPLRLYVSPMSDDTGKAVGALAMVEDITELRRLEQVRSDFVANVSHELKTPLTSIKGFVETLMDGAINNPEMAEKFLKIIMLEAERLTRLINDILSISKLETGMNEVVLERIRLDKMAFDVADMLRIHASETEVTINAHVNKKPVYIIGNPDRVEQMLINLVENAIKYNVPGGSVTVLVFGNEREANITISDTGIGIAEENLPRLFERFYRVDKGRSRSMGGTGLGLAIVKHIIRSMNGEIEVHSKLGEGTEFLITLPVAPLDMDDLEA